METYRNKYEKYGNLMEGFFKAPATGKYRFYITCDDNCELQFDAANPYDTTTPPTYVYTKVAYRSGAVAFRDIHRTGSKTVSDWIDLVKDKRYSMQGKHIEGSGDDHMTVSVEFQTNTPPANHPHIMKAEQKFEIVNTD